MSLLRAEARRAARRWTTPALRVGVAGLVGGALVLVQTSFSDSNAWRTGEGGRAMFQAGTWTLLLALFTLAPTLGALGMEEERAGSRLDLLLLTRIPAWRLFADKVGGRLLLVLALLAAALPFLALTTTYGGVAPAEVVSTALTAAHVSGVLAFLGGWLALRLDRGVLAAGLAVILGGTLWFLLPLWLARGDLPVGLTHPWTLVGADPWLALATAATSLPALLLILVHGARRMAGRPRHPWLSAGLSLVSGLFVLLSPLLTHLSRVLLRGAPAWMEVGAWFALLSLTTLGVVWVAGWALDRASSLHGRRLLLGPRQGPPLRIFSRVWSNPVAWRELTTRAYGRMVWAQVFAVGSMLALLGLAFLVYLSDEGLDELEFFFLVGQVALGAMLLGWSLLVTGYLAGRISSDEATHGTLEALTLTTLDKRKLLLGKLAAPAAHGLLPALAGLVLSHVSVLIVFILDWSVDNLLLGLVLWSVELAVLMALTTAGWAALTLGGLSLGLLLPRPRWAPGITVTVAALALPPVVTTLPLLGGLSLVAASEHEVVAPLISISVVVALVLAGVASLGWALAWHRLQPERTRPH